MTPLPSSGTRQRHRPPPRKRRCASSKSRNPGRSGSQFWKWPVPDRHKLRRQRTSLLGHGIILPSFNCLQANMISVAVGRSATWNCQPPHAPECIMCTIPVDGLAQGLVKDSVKKPGLKPQIGHNIGFQAPISTRSAWSPSRADQTACVGWCSAEECARDGPKQRQSCRTKPASSRKGG